MGKQTYRGQSAGPVGIGSLLGWLGTHRQRHPGGQPSGFSNDALQTDGLLQPGSAGSL